MMKPLFFLVAGLALFSSAADARPLANVDTLSPDTLSRWMTSGPPSDFLLIDIRETSEMTSIIATETCRPYHLAWTSHSFDSSVTKLPKDKAIVLYCASGYRSGKADSSLLAAGFTDVHSLSGGFGGWHGSTEPFSYVKPVSDLPAPSMLRTSMFVAPAAPYRLSGNVRLNDKNGTLVCSTLLSGPHAISFFSIDGRCMGKMLNPFSNHLSCRPRAGLGCKVFMARLETSSFEAIPLMVTQP
jgi:rhodanese-related sulfurtransferase